MNEKIIKYFNNEMSATERIELLRERESNNELKQEFSEFQNVQAILTLSSETVDTRIGTEKLDDFKKIKRKNRRIRVVEMALGYAAAICFLVIITWQVTTRMVKPTDPGVGQQEVYAPPGQRARINLSDGTIAWLNSGSTLRYPSVFANERMVELTGEAYFEVAKDTEKPFIVSAGNINIKALGTRFVVCNYPQAGYMSAILISGSVKIYESGLELKGVILSPNQKLVYENGKFVLDTIFDNDFLLWKDGIYSFKKERLESIINKLELYFDVKIVVEDPSILRQEYTGKFRQQDGVVEILRIIQKIHPFKIEKKEDLNQIILSKY